MVIQIKVIKEPVETAPITGSTWQITAIMRQSIALIRDTSWRERRERQLSAARSIGAQLVKAG